MPVILSWLNFFFYYLALMQLNLTIVKKEKEIRNLIFFFFLEYSRNERLSEVIRFFSGSNYLVSLCANGPSNFLYICIFCSCHFSICKSDIYAQFIEAYKQTWISSKRPILSYYLPRQTKKKIKSEHQPNTNNKRKKETRRVKWRYKQWDVRWRFAE
jgi:hypothetical protein